MKRMIAISGVAVASVALILIFGSNLAKGQSSVVGPGPGGFEKDHLTGQFAKWDRKATPMLVLRIHGAGMLQTFARIDADGSFKLPLPEVPVEGNFGSMNCGGRGKGNIVVASDVSLLTTLPGFSSPGRWDRGHSVIGGAFFSDEAFSKKIGQKGGRRAQWLHSHVARTVEAGECNNTNSFSLEKGWNAFTVVSGPSGGPHTYHEGLDDDLGWYWYGFPESMSRAVTEKPKEEEAPEPTVASKYQVTEEWLHGEWSGAQVDVTMKMQLHSNGDVQLESVEGGRKKSMEGKWSLSGKDFVLEIPEGTLPFKIEQTSDVRFRLYGETTGGSDIVFRRKR